MNSEFTKEDLLIAERAVNSIIDKYDELIAQKKSKETDLSLIKQDLRIGGFRNDLEYKRICQNQKLIIQELGELQPKINEMKHKLRAKRMAHEEIQLIVSGNKKVNSNVSEKIYELRDTYSAFASDGTRVSSTRLMASKFVEELQILINLLEKP